MSENPVRGHNPEKCGLNCERCQAWIAKYCTPKSKKGVRVKSGRKTAVKAAKGVEKAVKLTGYGRLHKDVDGNIIAPYESKAIVALCLKCKNDCKQRGDVEIMLCDYDPIVPRKKRTTAETENTEEVA